MINARYVDGLELRIKELSKKLSDESNSALHLIAENKSLKAERNALAAQVIRMSTFIKLSAEKWKGVPEVEPTFWNLLRVANETPQHHLRELRAEAGRAGFIAGFNTCFNYEGMMDLSELSNNYAQQIKNGW